MHKDEGHYAGKHPEETVLNKLAAEAVRAKLVSQRISCRDAHKAAEEAEVSPAVIGQTLDLLEVRINGCQLGLFGNKGKDHGRAGFRMPENAEALKSAIESASGPEGISCSDLWEAAEKTGRSKVEAAAVCEAAEIKINDCQLGAF